MNSDKQGQGSSTALRPMDWLAGLSILILLLILSIPGDWVAAVEAWVKSLISLPERPPSPGWLPTDKVVHVLLFLLTSVPVTLAVFQHLSNRLTSRLPVMGLAMLIMIAIALLSEWIQVYVPGRSADLWDLLADIIGIVIGVLIGVLNGIRIDMVVFTAQNRRTRKD